MKVSITVKDFKVHGVGDRFPDEEVARDVAVAIAEDVETSLRFIGALVDRGQVIVTLTGDEEDEKTIGRS